MKKRIAKVVVNKASSWPRRMMVVSSLQPENSSVAHEATEETKDSTPQKYTWGSSQEPFASMSSQELFDYFLTPPEGLPDDFEFDFNEVDSMFPDMFGMQHYDPTDQPVFCHSSMQFSRFSKEQNLLRGKGVSRQVLTEPDLNAFCAYASNDDFTIIHRDDVPRVIPGQRPLQLAVIGDDKEFQFKSLTKNQAQKFVARARKRILKNTAKPDVFLVKCRGLERPAETFSLSEPHAPLVLFDAQLKTECFARATLQWGDVAAYETTGWKEVADKFDGLTPDFVVYDVHAPAVSEKRHRRTTNLSIRPRAVQYVVDRIAHHEPRGVIRVVRYNDSDEQLQRFSERCAELNVMHSLY